MVSIVDIERAASRLRQHLRRAQLPELRLLCGLKFFDQIAAQTVAGAESYLREFIPQLARAAQKSSAWELLPEETKSLGALIKVASEYDSGVVHADDLSALQELSLRITSTKSGPREFSVKDDAATLGCLFVEHYPDLDLAPRGRLLNLSVTVNSISSRAENDDVVVRNPVEEPDDRFLAQARDSILAARTYLHRQFGLPMEKRYRFDFAVDSTGARFTGDSLGVAFAVGAIAAVARTEIFPDQLSLMPEAVFSGALSPDGQLAPVDSEALKLKIYRAFHSSTSCLVIPADHLAEAETYARGLESGNRGRTLELAGAESLDSVISDPRLACRVPVSRSVYFCRKLIAASRSPKFQVPVLLTLAALLYAVVCSQYPKAWIGFDWNPAQIRITDKGFVTLNQDSIPLWEQGYECDAITSESKCKVFDLDGDGNNEVLFVPKSVQTSACESNANLFVYEKDGSLLFRRHCAIQGEYPGDSTLLEPYTPEEIDISRVGDRNVVVTRCTISMPARLFLKFWSETGDSLGWYINAGFSGADNKCYSDKDERGLMFLSYNNRMGGSCFFAISPTASWGASPPYSDSVLEGLGQVRRGNQSHYILFPRSDLNGVSGYQYNSPCQIVTEPNGVIRVEISETAGLIANLWYYLDKRLRVTSVAASDEFMAKRKVYVRKGELEPVDWQTYHSDLRDSVRYWTDSGWVSEGQLRALEAD